MGIDNQYVSFSTISRNKDGLIYRRVGGLLLIVFFLLILIPTDILDSSWRLILVATVMVLFITVGIKSNGVKGHGYDETGKIVLFPECVQIVENSVLIEFLMEEVEVLTFRFSGYKNQPVFMRSFASNDGFNNFITIKTQSYHKSFEVFVGNQYKINILHRLLQHYQNLGVSNSFEDSYSSDAKVNLIERLFAGLRHLQG